MCYNARKDAGLFFSHIFPQLSTRIIQGAFTLYETKIRLFYRAGSHHSHALRHAHRSAKSILALYTPAAIPGLTVGCVLANISSVAVIGPIDMLFGSLASCIAAVLMYMLRRVRIFKLPVPAALMPALVNGLIVGFEIDFFIVGQGSFHLDDFILQGGCVALGELAVLFVLGLPLSRLLELRGIDKKYLQIK